MTCDRCEELETLLGLREQFPPSLRLSRTSEQVLGMLLRRDYCSHEGLYTAVWGGRPEIDQPGSNIVSVYLHKVRAALKPHGIEVSTHWGRGFYLTAENKQKLRALCEAART